MIRARGLAAIPVAIVLLMALAEFGQAWYYPGGPGGVAVTRSFGGAFRMTLWLAASATIGAFLLRHGPRPLAATLAPFAPFLAWGAVVVVLWSVDRVAGIRALVFWTLGCGAAAVAGASLPERTLARSVALLFAGVAAASLLLAVLDPLGAHTVYGDQMLVRGFFPHKNQLGWYCAIGLVWTVALVGPIGMPLAAVVALPLVAGLVAADSTTSNLIAVAGVGYLAALRLALSLFRDGGRAALAMGLALAVVAAAVTLLAPALVAQLGRDTTLTGRTEVWQHYAGAIAERGLTGYGTAVFSAETDLNRAIGGSVPGLERENLHSPHNVYLGLLGEVGVVGLATFLFAQLWLALVQPFRAPSRWLRLSAALAFAVLFAGLAEMRDAYAPGVATIALVAARARGLGTGRPDHPAAPRQARRTRMPSRA